MGKFLKKFLLFLGSTCTISSAINVASCSYSQNPKTIEVKYNNSIDSPTIVGYIEQDETIDDKTFTAVVTPSSAPNDVTFTIQEGTDQRIKIGGTNNNQLVWGKFSNPDDITFNVIATSNVDRAIFGEIKVTLSIKRPNPTSIELKYSGESTNLVATIKDTTKSTGKIYSEVSPSYAHPEVTYQIKNNDSSVDISLDSDGYITWPQFQTPTNQDIHFDVVGTAVYGGVTDTKPFTLKAIYAKTTSVELSYSSQDTNLTGYISEEGSTGTDKLSAVVHPDNADQSITYEINIPDEYKNNVTIDSNGIIKWTAIDTTIDSIPFSVVAKSTADPTKVSDPMNFDLMITRRNPTSLRVDYSESTNLQTTILNQTKSTGTLSVAVDPVLAFNDYEWIISDPNNLGIAIDQNNYITWNTFNQPTDTAKSFSIQARALHGGVLSNVINFTIKAIYQPATSVNILWNNSSTLKPIASGVNGQTSTITGLSAIVNPKPGTDQNVTWSIDNTQYFSIDQNGTITVKNTFPQNTTMQPTITATSKNDSTISATTQIQYSSVANNVYPYQYMQIDENGTLTDIDFDQASNFSEFVFPKEVTQYSSSIASTLNGIEKTPEKVSFAKGSEITSVTGLIWYGVTELDLSNCESLEVIDEVNKRVEWNDPKVKLEKIILPVNVKYFTGMTLKTCQDLCTIIWDGGGKNTTCQLNLSPTSDEPHIIGSAFQATSQRWLNSSDSKESTKGRFFVQNTKSTYKSSDLMAQFYNCSYVDYRCTPFTGNHWSAG